MARAVRFVRAALLSAALAGLAAAATAGGVLDRLDRLTGGSPVREFLPPDEAFVLSHDVDADGGLVVAFDIEPGYYLYRDKLALEPVTENLALADPVLPPGEMKEDPEFGRVAIYRDRIAVTAQLVRLPERDGMLEAVVRYQGCAEDGICYPPQRRTVSFLPTGAVSAAAPAPGAPVVAGLSDADRITRDLASRSLLATFATFLGLGLLLSLTPCVYPMVPILSGIIVGQREPVTTRRAVALSTTYVLAMALTYALAGVAAGLLGRNLQAAFQHPAVIVSFSLVFVLLALSMFGLFELQLPARVQSRLDRLSRSQRGGTYTGVAVMGVLSAVIVGPCVAPPLAGTLAYIGQTGSGVIGGLALFALGLGMGAPLIALGASAGVVLPRAGRWMETIKRVFGVVFLAVAVWFLERLLPGPLTLVLWGALAIGSAVFLGALDALERGAPVSARLGKGLGLGLLVYGAVLIVGASAGGEDPARPLAPLAGSPAPREANRFIAVKRAEDVEAAIRAARAQGRAVMLDVYADWCIECKHLERETFADAGVAARLAEMVLLRADVTANDPVDQALLDRFGLFGPPAVLFFRDGEERRQERLLGFADADEFSRRLDRL